MSTVDARQDATLTAHAKGAPEEILCRSTRIGGLDNHRPYRAWIFLGLIEATLVLGGFFFVLLWGIASEIAVTALLVYAPPLQWVFGTAALGITQVAFLLPFPLIVWGADELGRRRLPHRAAPPTQQPRGAGAGFGLG
jgi:hypothetical protein